MSRVAAVPVADGARACGSFVESIAGDSFRIGAGRFVLRLRESSLKIRAVLVVLGFTGIAPAISLPTPSALVLGLPDDAETPDIAEAAGRARGRDRSDSGFTASKTTTDTVGLNMSFRDPHRRPRRGPPA